MRYMHTQWTRERHDCYIVNVLSLYASYFPLSYTEVSAGDSHKTIEAYVQEYRTKEYSIQNKYVCGQIQNGNCEKRTNLSWVVQDDYGKTCIQSDVAVIKDDKKEKD
eukprot:173416_1